MQISSLSFLGCAIGMDDVVEQDQRTEAIKITESMLIKNQANREKIEKAVFKITYPLPLKPSPDVSLQLFICLDLWKRHNQFV
jgi:hypothetical protein